MNMLWKNKPVRIIIIITLLLVASGGVLLIISGKKIFRVGEMVPVEDFELCVRDYGKGKPTVIIEAGLNCSKHLYYGLQYRLSRHNRVIAYDHAGISESTESSNPRTLPYYIEELREMMKYKNLSPPYIFIGHSLGGHIIRYYAWLYPDEVAGMVFLDHAHEDWFNYIRATWTQEEQDKYFEFWDPQINSHHYEGTGLKELIQYEANCDTIRGKQIPEDMPVLMFSANSPFHYRKTPEGRRDDRKAWADMQGSLIEGVTYAKHIVDWETGHSPHTDKPRMVYKEIKEFIGFAMEKYEEKQSLQ